MKLEKLQETFTDIYTVLRTDSVSADDLFKDLPQLGDEQKRTLRSPGIDGLPVDFYQCFWDVIEQDFYEVLLGCIRSKTLPTSCR